MAFKSYVASLTSDPLKLCTFLVDACVSEGVQLHYPAKPISITKNASGELSGITIKSTTDSSIQTINCSTIVLASGAWTPTVFRDLFPDSKLQIPVTSLAGHHIVVKSPRLPVPSAQTLDGKVDPEPLQKECHAAFCSLPASMAGFSPEFFSRITGEIWFGGLNSSTLPLPELATTTKVEDGSIEQLKHVARKLLGSSNPEDEDDLEVLRKAVCFRPVTESGKPILSRTPDGKLGGVRSQKHGGVFVATGHGPWGIALSLGTGKVMAEMIEGVKTSADVSVLGF
jgi:glycine/D-amino acid oxidase-like deaminating enzyme